MTAAEVAVLSALSPDHALTTTEIQQASALTSWRTRNAVAQLNSRGLITSTHPPGRWRLTPRGRTALAVKAPRFR
ncbi:hypothetical protein [Nocardia concava]|uniref:hypothetical protein n=1 Tax=Nocardia concava TaxID=257281 RepID=UPI0002FD0CF5|nr:hypothetical protein [Nocardia concava]